MADKVVSLEFNVKTAGAVTEINKVTKATEGATAATINYEKQLDDIKKATDGGGFKDLSRALKEYQDIALKAGESSPIGRQALAEAGELKDRLLDLKGAIKTTGQDGLALQGSLQLGGGIVAGFGAVQGVMALVGSESEDLQKTLVKLQAVQATLASVEEIRAVLEKESALRIMAVTVAEKARAAATAVSTFVTNGSTLALKAFRVALIGTGIGAIVVLLIAAADAMGLFGESADDAAKKVEDLNKKLEKQSDLTKKLNEDIDNNTKVQKLKAQIAGKTEADIIQIEKDAQAAKTKNFYDYYLKTQKANDLIKANQKASAEDRLTFLKNEQDAYNTWQNSVNETLIINLEKEKELADKAREKEKEAADKAREIQKQKDAEFRRKRQESEKNISDIIKQGDEEIERVREEKQKKKEDADQKEKERRIKLQKDEEEFNKWKENEEQRVFDTKINLALMGFNIINELAALSGNKSEAAMKRAFEINKAFQIAQAINEGTRGVLKAYAEAPPGFKIASAVLAGTFAAVQVAKISQSKFNSTKFDNNKPADVPLTAAAPTQTTAPQTPGRVSNITGSQTTTVKAIVVESDITTTQKRINSIQEIAKI